MFGVLCFWLASSIGVLSAYQLCAVSSIGLVSAYIHCSRSFAVRYSTAKHGGLFRFWLPLNLSLRLQHLLDITDIIPSKYEKSVISNDFGWVM